jgi:hypothetical protein
VAGVSHHCNQKIEPVFDRISATSALVDNARSPASHRSAVRSEAPVIVANSAAVLRGHKLRATCMAGEIDRRFGR